MPIRQINKVFIENFYLYIIKNHDCSPNMAMKFIQHFRTVINFAQGTGSFANYKLKFEYIGTGFLNKDEISKICNKDLASKDWNRYGMF
ncbi:phage integrase SAM-like domain-containing protein [uncultured Bacteroides sp.]|uniref:phage integrase SAM-like domain-containing protein n=1 Tax=uncultured Bacteroides sp. TaxID=162156 RepID=UPI002AAB2E33|nr:phage integrase SAM-like domain-containing protein [uncultured Bacteroides sp.]